MSATSNRRPPSLAELPANVRRFIGDAALRRTTKGESPCAVHWFKRRGERFFLKHSAPVLAPTTYSVRREAAVLRWLAGRLPVPEVVAAGRSRVGDFMVVRAVPGEPLARSVAARQTRRVTEAFREALHMLRGVSVRDCPFDSRVPVRLRELKYLADRRLLDADADLAPWPGLTTVADVLAALRTSRPDDRAVFSHGDLGDSNVFIDARDRLHFIDFGRGGIADSWLDVAFVYRNLREDFSARCANRFVAACAGRDEPERRRYFELLDELF